MNLTLGDDVWFIIVGLALDSTKQVCKVMQVCKTWKEFALTIMNSKPKIDVADFIARYVLPRWNTVAMRLWSDLCLMIVPVPCVVKDVEPRAWEGMVMPKSGEIIDSRLGWFFPEMERKPGVGRWVTTDSLELAKLVRLAMGKGDMRGEVAIATLSDHRMSLPHIEKTFTQDCYPTVC